VFEHILSEGTTHNISQAYKTNSSDIRQRSPPVINSFNPTTNIHPEKEREYGSMGIFMVKRMCGGTPNHGNSQKTKRITTTDTMLAIEIHPCKL
jgi:hypothetical protein